MVGLHGDQIHYYLLIVLYLCMEKVSPLMDIVKMWYSINIGDIKGMIQFETSCWFGSTYRKVSNKTSHSKIIFN